MKTPLPGSSTSGGLWLQQLDRDIRSSGWIDVPILISSDAPDLARLVARAMHDGRPGWQNAEFAVVGPDVLAERLAGLAAQEAGRSHDETRAALSHGGRWTLCLDGVDRLTMAAQEMLLYFLDGLYASTPIPSVQIMATASPELTARVADGRFRSDLFYRLNVLHIALPASQSFGAQIRSLLERVRADRADVAGGHAASLRVALGGS